MAAANMTLITRAEITSAASTATGRKALVLDGTTIELGFTGVMDVTSLAVGLASGSIELWRAGDRAVLNFINVVPTASASNWAVFTGLPVGFRSASVVGGEGGVVNAGTSSAVRRTNWTKGGNVSIYSVVAGEAINGTIEITALGWPAALIGASTSTVGWV